MHDAGCRMRNGGGRPQNSEVRRQEIGCTMHDAGYTMGNAEGRNQDSEFRIDNDMVESDKIF